MHADLGDVPPVYANGGELNQVFVNLIVNAAHAVERARRARDDLRGHALRR